MADVSKFRSLAENWETLGDIDPLYSVLSDPAKSGRKWNPDEFFASGRTHVQQLWRTLIDVRATFERGQCLDFGCGVGRLTIPLSEAFRHTIGIDVARPMIEAARRRSPTAGQCEFVLNRDPDLRQFADNCFDFVHSCLVLQHIPPQISLRYIGEFLRVCRPGGLVVFQLPALRWTEAELMSSHPLPDAAFAASISFVAPPAALEASGVTSLSVRVMNRSQVSWPSDIPAGRHLCVGNHWLRDDGTVVITDDGRAFLPRRVEPGESVDVALAVRAPDTAGHYVLEVDLVQEHVAWFAHKGSATARTPVIVTGMAEGVPYRETPQAVTPVEVVEARGPRMWPLLKRLMRRVRGGTPTFEMHVVPRTDVEQAIRDHGGLLIRVVADNASGPGWQSFTYVVRRVL